MISSLKILKWSIGIVLFSAFFYVSFVNIDPDFWWHIKVGEWMVQNQAIPHFDIYSHTMPGHEWVNHEWLVDTGLWFLYSRNLWWLLALLFSLMAFTPFYFWLKRYESAANILLIAFAGILMLSFVGVRPQIISFLFFFLVFEMLSKNTKKERASPSIINRYSMWLPVIFLIWANLHGGFFSGLILFGLFTLVDCFRVWKEGGNLFKDKDLRFNMAILFTSLLAVFINPYGWKLYDEVFTVATSAYTMAYVFEWKSIMEISRVSMVIFAAIFTFFIFKFIKKYSIYALAAGLFFLLMFFKSARMGPLFFIIAMPILDKGIGFVKKDISISQLTEQPNSKILYMFRIAVVLILAWFFIFFVNLPNKYPASVFPDKAVAFLKSEFSKTKDIKLFNEYGWGGYIIWNAPEIKIFIDGRMPHWMLGDGGSAMGDYVNVFRAPDGVTKKEILERRKINTVILSKQIINRSKWYQKYLPQGASGYLSQIKPLRLLGDNLAEDSIAVELKDFLLKEDWKIAYEDEIAVVMECRSDLCGK